MAENIKEALQRIRSKGDVPRPSIQDALQRIRVEKKPVFLPENLDDLLSRGPLKFPGNSRGVFYADTTQVEKPSFQEEFGLPDIRIPDPASLPDMSVRQSDMLLRVLSGEITEIGRDVDPKDINLLRFAFNEKRKLEIGEAGTLRRLQSVFGFKFLQAIQESGEFLEKTAMIPQIGRAIQAIAQPERLEREFDLSIVFTAPSVRYRFHLSSGEIRYIDNPTEYPDPTVIAKTEEPYIVAQIISPKEYVGNIINLCLEKRGIQGGMNYLDAKRVELRYDLPLGEIVFDFYDRLKSLTRGYASFDYELGEYHETDLVKLDILINGKPVDALSQLVFKANAYKRARLVCQKLKEEIPRQQFKIPIQGMVGNSIIARETISALRKDVTAKCYGGDITRKRKLLEKQKAGKKRMKTVGNVQLPQSAFLSVLKTTSD